MTTLLNSIIYNYNNSSLFCASTSPLSLNIKASLFHLRAHDFIIEFLWISSHAGVSGNEVANLFAISTKYSTKPDIRKIPSTDFLNLLKTNFKHAWQNKWVSVVLDFATWYRSLSTLTPITSSQP